ncbi:hypothetical protein GCM10023321_25800 [Pseudonocardia eucalypti]|uniref:CBS domain-containing protein n=1 Tax=Pseudonocardia eucalypti TaxID=648755 RepID=A0ABP9Q5B2_9PSEU
MPRPGVLNTIKRLAMRPHSLDDAGVRNLLARQIVRFSFLGILVASVVALFVAKDKEEVARLILASLVPLFGTWVGTVLAFYYAKDSLQTATDSTIRLVGKSDPLSPTSTVMIPRSDIEGKKLAAGDDPNTLHLTDIRSDMEAARRQRWPIFNADDEVTYVVHKSTLDAYFAAHPSESAPPTVASLLAMPSLASLISAIGFVKPTDTVSLARTVMRSVPYCNDVFITASGEKNGPVLGWLTNTMLANIAS